MKFSRIKSWKLLAAASMATLLLGGCGGKDEEASAIIDNTEEVEQYYATFKRVPLSLKARLTAGEITQGEFDQAPGFPVQDPQ